MSAGGPSRWHATAAVSWVAASVGLACCESVPTVPLDFSGHDACSESLPYDVDASASEIQCFIEDAIIQVSAGMMVPTMPPEIITNEPGDPICCEVCAKKGTADQACDAMCNWLACDRARDEHVTIGNELGTCEPPDCGFSFEACMSNAGLHPQWIDLNDFLGEQDDFYALKVDCTAHATEPARPDGLFTYVEQLDGVPNAGGASADVTDVVQWCLAKPSGTGGGGAASTSTGDILADESSGDTTAGPSDDGVDPPALPQPCGPWAKQSSAVDPTDNFGTWNERSQGTRSDGESSQPLGIAGGGVEYSLMPCWGEASQECLRIDKLSVRLVDPASMLVVDLNLLQRTDLMPISATGWVDVPAGALRFGARYEIDEADSLLHVVNTVGAQARLDPIEGNVDLVDLEASASDGDLWVDLALRGTLLNTQPHPEIMVTPGPAWNTVVLGASTFDAEYDPISHRWMVLGQGAWTGDEVEVSLPAGRHAVVLYADDVKHARGIAATWVEVPWGGLP